MIVRLLRLLGDWADERGGAVNAGIGVIYADDDNVIPDVVWISAQRLAEGLDAAGHLTQVGPELVVEVVSPGSENARRDREAKLALYSRRDAVEYWIVDPIARTVHQYHRARGGPLRLRGVVSDDQWLTSDVLEGFAVRVSELWP